MGTSSQVEAAATEAAEYRSFSLRQRVSLWLITWAGYLLIRWLCPTLRFTVIREPDCLSDGWGAPNGIWCFWHRCVIPAGYRFRGKQVAVMISRSFDGEYIARILGKLGYRPVRGSSSRGAVGALMGMRQELEAGHPAVFTIDGPRGPRFVAKPGPVLLAKKTGQPINCFYIAVERAWILNSWDRMIIPKPFSRACAYFSSPMPVPADASEEQMAAFHQQMQETLERCRLKADGFLDPGRT
ncbi:MAG TPA: lysophospholipid acyltransferase family protein [Candidatus Angelobacter sp.]